MNKVYGTPQLPYVDDICYDDSLLLVTSCTCSVINDVHVHESRKRPSLK